ncbi:MULTISPECIES: ABC transporter ATP-binding protein [unclassified Paenibacillus]|jgi:ABC-type multidrug transport system fused ATPase/permease subunit|uniref:ABC transporter ATP-binding protein n=2 Tax=Paenibacillus TaxID=44249 RepID=UPI0004F6BE15|nr:MULTISPECIES: ABC transporter ATP-binding protein [unclassified Paenibacillus]AIQ27579.1 multidrug ABC transporter [Paenibacillus sp. FSL P4-0081]OMF22158.1 multidrug ABC transporter [Paenibacillus sp. FSL H8-0259]
MQAIIYYFRQLQRLSGAKLYLNLSGMVISGLLESSAILLLVPMLGMAGIQLGGTATAGLHLPMLGFISELPQTTALLLVLGGYVLIVLCQNLISRSVAIRNVEIQQTYGRQLRYEVYSALLRAEWSFFLKKRTSDLINVMTTELARVLAGISCFLQFLTSLLFTLVQIGFAFWLSPKMTLSVLVCAVLLSLFSRRFIRKAKKLGSRSTELGKTYLGGITDQLNGIKDIKSNNLEHSRLEWLHAFTGEVKQEQLDYTRLRSNSQLLYKLSSTLLIAVFIFVSFRFMQAEGPNLLLVILVFTRLWPTFSTLQSLMEQLASVLPSFKQLQQLQDECLAAVEHDRVEGGEAVAPMILKHGLEARNVDFRYHPHEPEYSLQNVNVSIPARKMTAIVGRSGAGKSTLVDLLMGLMQPETGEILADGAPITGERLLSYRRSIGYVAQDPFLYNATIRDNLTMIKPDAEEAELWEALEFASSADFVRKLPDGLDTLLGDRGVRLSGGERQRLVLARAIIRKPSILVLDEATSALDTENEKRIQEALERLKASVTVIVIAHRLSTIRGADQILVIDQGRVIQQGIYSGLASEKGGMFSRLLSGQEEAI